MVDIHVNDNTNQIRINVNPTSNSVSSTIGNEAFYNGLAKEWAISENLVQGEDYSAKHYAQLAKVSEDIARQSIDSENKARVWAEGTDEEVQILGGEHSSKGWVDYVIENAPTASVEQTAEGATLTVTDINGTTTTTILNGQNGQNGADGYSPTATVTQSGDITTISITDKNGTTTESIDLSDKQDLLVSGTNIKTINNQSLLGNGNITIQGGGGTVDQTYSPTSANAQSGVAINGAGFLQNKATNTSSLAIKGTILNNANHSTVVGCIAFTPLDYSTVLGAGSGTTDNGIYGTALGAYSEVQANSGIQLGYGTNSTANTLSVGFFNNSSIHYNWQLLDGTTGYIPNARINMDSSPTSASTNTVTSGGVYTALSNKQDTLVSGTNIKTINNQSLLGSGNIDIQSGVSMTYDSTTETLTFA